MLFGQRVEIFTDHTNLIRDTLGLIEEYGPESMYIRGVDNTADGAISRLGYDPTKNRHADDEDSDEYSSDEKWNNFLTLFKHYAVKSSDISNVNDKYKYRLIVKHLQIT